MLLSCNKLKTYIKDSDKIDWLKVWDIFTIRTAEVEDVKQVGNSFDGVVVAEIKECVEHPNSDHMHILQVDCGEKELIEVVCGAPNVKVGLKTALVRVGGHIDGFEITPRPLRGVVSNGMCCSKKELGISEDHTGIIELPADAPVGMDIKKYLPIEDIIVEIDNKSLTNRPDLWGHYGIAREIAAITNHELLELDVEEIKNDKKDLDIKIKNPELCLRYSGLKIDNIKNNVTPMDMQIFLDYVGMRSISLIVDLTNYLMLELGQPMHAFDSRIVKNIEVGNANDNETFTTLDGIERKLDKDMLMIKNGNEYFAIAGVMGGLDSEIREDTDSLFLESATFNAGSIRKTAVRLGLRTEASSRYEKSLDPNMTELAIKRFVYLLRKENKDLEIATNLTDCYPKKVVEGNIVLTKKKLNIYMGQELEDKVVENILTSLGFKVKTSQNEYEVTVPTYRHTKDIFIEEDLIEEIARIYGLENIAPTPLKLELLSSEKEDIFNQEYEVKKTLALKYNLHEVHSYLWYDSEMLKELKIEKDGIKLLGKSENNVLRDDMSLSLMNIVNLNYKNYRSFGIFEIGTIIENNKNKRVLSIILANEEAELETAYNKAKEIIKYVFRVLKNKNVDILAIDTNKEYYDNNLAKKIVLNDQTIGQINVLKKPYLNRIAKKKALVAIDIDFDKYVLIEKEEKRAQEVSKYPVVELDYTVVMNDKRFFDLKTVLNKFTNELINDWELLGVYENKYTIRMHLGSKEKTLEQEDLQNFKNQLIDYLKKYNLLVLE